MTRVRGRIRRAYFLLLMLSFANYAEAQNPMVESSQVKLKKFNGLIPEEGVDVLIHKAAAYVPGVTPLPDFASISKDEIASMIYFEAFNSDVKTVNNERYPLSSVDLVFKYSGWPGFMEMKSRFSFHSALNSKQEEIALKGNDERKYLDLGLVRKATNGFNLPGEDITTLRFKSELEWGLDMRVLGTMHINYPKDYDWMLLGTDDRGKIREVNDIKYELISIEKNLVTLRVEGDKRKMSTVKIVALNKDRKPFDKENLVEIDHDLYNLSLEYGNQVPLGKLEEYARGIDRLSAYVNEVIKIQVSGMVSEVAIYKLIQTGNAQIPVDVSVEIR